VGTITSGTGLISGLDYQSLVDKLIAVDAAPRDLLLKRVSGLNAQKTAYLSISARITALLSRVTVLSSSNPFRAATATSSLPDVLSASTTSSAEPGAYSFVVRALASTNQFVTRGFADASAPLSAGTLTIESAQARVNASTRLDELNGYAGVRRGTFKILNGTQAATINISDALTVGEVLDKINAAGIQVSANVTGDALVLKDTSGAGNVLRVQEVSGSAAADLGFGAGHSQGTGELIGGTIMYLSNATALASLNDGLGVRTAIAGGDFTIQAGGKDISVSLSEIIGADVRLGRLNHGQGVRLGTLKLTARDGRSATVDLSSARTIGDVRTALQNAFGDARISVVLTGSRLVVSDKTDVSGLDEAQRSNFIIEDVTGNAARDLGIDGTSSSGKISGRDILHMDTLADVATAITYAVNNETADGQPIVTAAIAGDGQRLELRTTSGAMVLTPPSTTSRSRALEDLGFAAGTYEDTGSGAVAVGGRIIGSLNTVLLRTLNGGAGFAGSTVTIEANGKTATVDVAGAQTLEDVIALINQATDVGGGGSLGIEAGYDNTGTRLLVRNLGSATPITLGGDFAESLGLAQTASEIRSNNLQRRYISEATRLDSLNNGRGISRGKVKITGSRGAAATLDLSSPSLETLQDVIEAINKLTIGVQASINATGDGLLITDTGGGAGTLKIEEDGSRTAQDLNILGTAQNGQIDGAFEFRLAIGGSDTLSGLASRIGAETTLATATVLNDGTGVSPFRLNIAARVSGARGELIIDDSAANLGVTTLARAQDARVYFGGNADSGVLLTSATNSFSNVVPGLTFTANAVSDQAVTVTVGRDLKTLVTSLQGFVDDFNAALDAAKEAGAYDADTQTAAILQGEGTLYTVRSRLGRLATTTFVSGGLLHRLSDLGIKVSSGGKLSFDETAFRETYEADPAAVERFFTDETTGAAAQMKEALEAITGSEGLINRRADTLQSNSDLLQARVTQMNEQLERKRARLLTQFQAMETALAALQSQQAALASLSTEWLMNYSSSSGS